MTAELGAISPSAARALAAVLEQSTGQQLGTGRRWRIETALQPIMRAHNLATLEVLASQVTQAPNISLREAVVEALLNHETSFFRDLPVFKSLGDEVMAELAQRRAATQRLRVWCAGCSTGQEAYSVALLIAGKPQRWAGWTIDILGTDVSPTAVAQARDGLYSQFEVQRGLPIGDLLSRFDQEGEDWRIRSGLPARTSFMVHSLLDPPPPGRFDLILCRNVLLYFEAERRRAVLDRLASALAPDGILMLGAGETVLGQTDAFEPDPVLRGFYRSTHAAS